MKNERGKERREKKLTENKKMEIMEGETSAEQSEKSRKKKGK